MSDHVECVIVGKAETEKRLIMRRENDPQGGPRRLIPETFGDERVEWVANDPRPHIVKGDATTKL